MLGPCAKVSALASSKPLMGTHEFNLIQLVEQITKFDISFKALLYVYRSILPPLDSGCISSTLHEDPTPVAQTGTAPQKQTAMVKPGKTWWSTFEILYIALLMLQKRDLYRACALHSQAVTYLHNLYYIYTIPTSSFVCII